MSVESQDDLDSFFCIGEFADEATYAPPGGGAPIPCRTIKWNSDRAAAFGESQIIGEGTFIDVLAKELTPLRNGVFTIGGESFLVVGDPVRNDADRAIWTCTVKPQ